MSNPVLLSHFFLRIADADALPELMQSIERLVIESSLHGPDIATLVLHDPQLRWIDAPELDPGVPIKIWAAVGTREEQLFDGEIVELEPEFSGNTQRFVVRAYDRLHRLAHGRQTRSFVQVSDADLFQKLAAEVGLEARIEGGESPIPYLLQANTSSLNLLRERAARLGQLLYVEGTTLHCAPPQSSAAAVELTWGADLMEFRPQLTTLGQVQRVVVRGWNPETREEITAVAEAGDDGPQIGEARSGGALVQAAFQITTEHQVTALPVRSQTRADQLAQATARRRATQFVTAEGMCRGNPAVVAGITLRIAAVGDRFSGAYFVTEARHRYGATGYRTEFQISGLDPATLFGQRMPQPGSASALAIGIVTDNLDPQGQGRVKLRFPWLSGEHTSDWARIAAPGAGAERGMQWLPEIDDEVLVGFELGDVQHPYVLGGLWNGVDAPPRPSDELVGDGKVQQRVLRSRTGHVIVLDDSDEGGVRVEDRNGNMLVLSSKDNRLRLEDRRGNTIILDAEQNSISIKAKGEITLEAGGSLSLKGNGVRIDGGAGPVDIDGSMIDLN